MSTTRWWTYMTLLSQSSMRHSKLITTNQYADRPQFGINRENIYSTLLISFTMTSSLHSEIHSITDTEEHARDFLFRRGILKQTLSCSSCNTPVNLIPCSASKSPDLLIWRCPPCKKFRNIRTDSALSGQKLSLQQFLILLFDISIKSLTNIAIAQLTHDV